MTRLLWSSSARRDLYGIARFYGQFDPDLPLKLLERMEAAPLILLDHPRIGSSTDRPGIRRWRAKGTPFLLFYAVRGDAVEIRAVRHDRSDWP